MEKQAAINEDLGQYEQAAAGYRETLHLRDSIQNAQFTAQLNNLHTIYEVDKITAEKERNRNYFLFAILACALLVIALAVWIVYSQRLCYALNQLHEHPEITLEAIALDSGHASYSTFFRAFSKTYGMSPTEYRRLAKNKV